MKKIIVTIILTLFILAGSFLMYIKSGSYDISQLVPHNKLTKWVIKTTTRNSIEKRIGNIQEPANLNDSTLIITGFEHYNEMCTSCHGGPGVEQWEMAEGLYPDPPKLYKFAEKLNPKKAFWIIKNGIKMTSMPAFGPTHSDDKIWAMTAFLTKKLGTMSPEEYHAWAVKYSEHEEEEHEEMNTNGEDD